MLAGLVRELRGGRPATALSGPGGLGKTMVLRVLAARSGRWARFIHVPYAALDPDGLLGFALGLTTGSDATACPREALASRGSQDHPLVLVLDDASALPVETARELAAWTDASGGAVRIVLGMVDDRKAGQVLAAFGDLAASLRLTDPMRGFETRRYVAARLAAARVAPADRHRFSDEVVAQLHAWSGGNPRVLAQYATRILMDEGAAPFAWGEPVDLAQAQPAGALEPGLDDLELEEALLEHETLRTGVN